MAKKANRYIGITNDVVFHLKLDPDIYNSQLATVLGVGSTVLEIAKQITCSIATAIKNGHAALIVATVAKGTAENDETRRIELICDIDNTDTAPALLVGKQVKLGYGANVVTWVITSASLKLK